MSTHFSVISLPDIAHTKLQELPPYHDGHKFLFISHDATEASNLEGLTVDQAWGHLAHNSRQKYLKTQVDYYEWCEGVGEDQDPRFFFDYLLDCAARKSWYTETKATQQLAWNRALVRLNPRQTPREVEQRVIAQKGTEWYEQQYRLVEPAIPTLRMSKHFIEIWKALPSLNFSDLEMVLKNPLPRHRRDRELWFLYDGTATEERMLRFLPRNDHGVIAKIEALARTALDNKYYGILSEGYVAAPAYEPI